MSRKKRTYNKGTFLAICFFCKDEFKCKAVDIGHIYEAHCNERRCHSSFLNLDFGGKEKYYRYLKGIQKGDIPVKRKKAGEGQKSMRQTVEFFDGKLYRLFDGVCLGSVLCRDTEDTEDSEDSEYVSVSKDPNGPPVKYRLKIIKGLEELIKYMEELKEETSSFCR